LPPAAARWACVVALLCGGCGQPVRPPIKATRPPAAVPASPVVFREVTPFAGVEFKYEHHPEADYRTILESLGGGVAMVDYDADGRLDLAFPGGGMYGSEKTLRGVPLGLFRNRGDWKFEPVATAAWADTPRHYSHGAAAGDYDRDGFPDLLITGYGGLQLWHNQGDGTFLEVQDAAGLSDRLWSTSAAWGDVNGDGELDLYVVHYVNWSLDNNPACPSQQDPGERDICSPKEFEPLPDTLYINQGDGTFRDGSKEAGLRTDGKGLGVVLADLDADSDLDLFVANDTTANFLYLNDGQGKLSEVGEINGAAANASGGMDGSMGVDVCDFNRDGLPDLFVANFETEDFALYRNLGQAQFEHDTRRAGISAVGTSQVAFGTQCADLDLDGDDEILVANGHTSLFPTFSDRKQKPILFWYDVGAFHPVKDGAGDYLDTPHLGRGLALGDLEGDGDLDAAVSHLEEPVVLLRNDQNSGNSWLAIRLIGVRSHRDAVGTRVVLHTARGDHQSQRCGGRSYLSSPECLIRFGIPAGDTIRGLTIHWPSGTKQELPPPKLDAELTVVEPSQ
jgi:hypothetical protein